jgi:hypothetical protein
MKANRMVRVSREFTPKMVCDLITTFIEDGGFNSWVAGVKFFVWDDASNEQRQVKYGETWADGSTFYEGRWSIDIKVDDEEGTVHRLGWKKLKWALERPDLQKRVNAVFSEDYDVEDASCIIQVAIFKEIVYG